MAHVNTGCNFLEAYTNGTYNRMASSILTTTIEGGSATSAFRIMYFSGKMLSCAHCLETKAVCTGFEREIVVVYCRSVGNRAL